MGNKGIKISFSKSGKLKRFLGPIASTYVQMKTKIVTKRTNLTRFDDFQQDLSSIFVILFCSIFFDAGSSRDCWLMISSASGYKM